MPPHDLSQTGALASQARSRLLATRRQRRRVLELLCAVLAPLRGVSASGTQDHGEGARRLSVAGAGRPQQQSAGRPWYWGSPTKSGGMRLVTEGPDKLHSWAREAWDSLRRTRSRPPGAAVDGQSADLYRAALQQSEDLMLAAKQTGHAARPLPLFYSLGQAGKAIVACRGGQEATRHGLSLGDPAEAAILDTAINIYECGWFRSVSDCTRSPIPSQAPRLGALDDLRPAPQSRGRAEAWWDLTSPPGSTPDPRQHREHRRATDA